MKEMLTIALCQNSINQFKLNFLTVQTRLMTRSCKSTRRYLEHHRGKTTAAHHYIPTSGTPTKVPPRRIPAHFKDEVTRQLQVMLEQGIIEESNSPWMSPMGICEKEDWRSSIMCRLQGSE